MHFAKHLRFFISAAALLLSVQVAQAQGPPPSGGPQPDPKPTAVPIDGGASLLLLGGAALGMRRLARQR